LRGAIATRQPQGCYLTRAVATLSLAMTTCVLILKLTKKSSFATGLLFLDL
jgi:hypothetical protein